MSIGYGMDKDLNCLNIKNILSNENRLIHKKKINEANEFVNWFVAGISNFINNAEKGHKIAVLTKNMRKTSSRIEFYGFEKGKCLSYDWIKI